MAAGDSLDFFTGLSNIAPTASYAEVYRRNGHHTLAFDQSSDENAIFQRMMNRAYGGNGITVILHWGAVGITTGNVVWNVAFERVGDEVQDIDSDSFATAQTATEAVPATDGHIKTTEIAFTDGAQIDSVAAGEIYRLKVTRDADNGSDTAAADALLWGVEIRETP